MLKSIIRSFFLLILLIPFTTYAQESLPWLHGTWEGVGYQPPTDSDWTVEMKYDSVQNTFRIDYPSLSCGGHWELVESRDGFAEFKEVITDGEDKCDNEGKVIVTQVDEDYISIAYFLPLYFDGVVAHTVLRKSDTFTKRIPVAKPGEKDKKT